MKTVLVLFALSMSALAGVETALRPGDRINITVGGITESDANQIRGAYTVSDDGFINLLHIKKVKAAGLKPSALQSAIENAYVEQEYYANPTVTVAIDPAAPPQVFVVRGCKANGAYPFTPGMTILQAVAKAQGFSDFAHPSQSTVMRGGKTIATDLSKNLAANDVRLEPGDQIVIKE